jgi:drug/metabolite transporter (DMT)-like permease
MLATAMTQPTPDAKRSRATAIGFSAVLMWSFLALLSSASGAVPPFQLVAMTFAIGGMTCGTRWIARPATLQALRQPLRVWLLGVVGLFGYHYVYFAAIRAAPAIEVSLIAYLWPLLIVVFSGFLPGEKLKTNHLVGTVLGLVGAMLVISKGNVATLLPDITHGHVLALACAVIWAGYSVLSRLFGEVPSDVVAGFCLVAAALALICHVAFETTVWPGTTLQWLAVLGLGILPLGLGFFTWDHGVKHGDIQLLGTLSYAAPVLSALVLTAAGQATFHWSIGAACVLISCGGVIAARKS